MSTTDPTRSTVAILQESLDTIKATYWIQGEEFVFSDLQADVQKFIDVQVSNGFCGDYERINDERQAKVTGVCSIGALALALHTLYQDPLMSFDDASSRDPMTWAAAAALVACMDVFWLEGCSSMAQVIAGWNDNPDRTREQVIALFEDAIKHPIARAKTIYCIRVESAHSPGWMNDAIGFSYATEKEADAFIADMRAAMSLSTGYEGLSAEQKVFCGNAGDFKSIESYAVQIQVPEA